MSKKFSKPELSRIINGDKPAQLSDAQEAKPGKRLDFATLERYPAYTRSQLQSLIKDGRVSVNGQTVLKSNTLVLDEDEIVLDEPDFALSDQALANAKPQIIFESEYVTVFDKPAGMLSIKKGDFCAEPAIEDYGLVVHRLDRDTSGVIITAKDEETRGALQKQFQQRKIHKCYYAIVEGCPSQTRALINVPIARDLKHPTTFTVDKDGREALTEFELIQTNGELSLVKLRPKTGRTHQLRIHMAYIGCPILGDPVYGSKSAATRKAARMYLHAASLEITVPVSERRIFESPLPEEFYDLTR